MITAEETPLHEAARRGHIEVVRFLLEKGAYVGAVNDLWGRTALHEAAKGGHIEVVRFLVENGANVNARDSYKKTPLGKVVKRSGKKYKKIANYLRSHGGIE